MKEIARATLLQLCAGFGACVFTEEDRQALLAVEVAAPAHPFRWPMVGKALC